jgi:hypothetical protein
MITGNRGAYRWIVWNSQFLRELVSAVPEIVVGKFAVITSLDSGPFIPSEDEVRRGWELKRGLAYSPKVLRADDLPHDQFDEWFVFSSRKEIDPPEVFVNYGGFRLRYYTADIETHSLLERFWRQMEILQPESYLAEGDFLILVTRNISLYEEGLGWNLPRPEENRVGGNSA